MRVRVREGERKKEAEREDSKMILAYPIVLVHQNNNPSHQYQQHKERKEWQICEGQLPSTRGIKEKRR